MCEKTEQAHSILENEVISALNALEISAMMEISYICGPIW